MKKPGFLPRPDWGAQGQSAVVVVWKQKLLVDIDKAQGGTREAQQSRLKEGAADLVWRIRAVGVMLQ